MDSTFAVVWRFQAGQRPRPDDRAETVRWIDQMRGAGLLRAWGWGASPVCRDAMAVIRVPRLAEALDLVMACPLSRHCRPDVFEWNETPVPRQALIPQV